MKLIDSLGVMDRNVEDYLSMILTCIFKKQLRLSMSKKQRPMTAASAVNPFNPYDSYLYFLQNQSQGKPPTQPFITTLHKSQTSSNHQTQRCMSASK